MTKLNQIIAIANGTKTRATSLVTELYHKIKKPTLFEGISRTYRSKDEDGDQLPPEHKLVQMSVFDIFQQASKIWTEMFDTVATQDYSNCSAVSDVTINGATILVDVPVTHLLFLEKQLNDVYSLVKSLPTLDPASKWEWSDNNNCYVSEKVETTRTKKVPKNHIKYPATKEHPAQIEMFTEDVLEGYWEKVDFSGKVPQKDKDSILNRVRLLQDAVKQARENANSMEITNVFVGKKIFNYLFETTAS